MLMTLNPNALQNNNLRPINGDSDMTTEINRLTKIIEEKDFQLKEKESKSLKGSSKILFNFTNSIRLDVQ